MKELSIEEKAKRFDESLEKARKLKDEYNDIEGYYPNQWLCEELFPKLKESEDERIRKALIKGVESVCKDDEIFTDGFTRKQIVAWLEKQGEQKPSMIQWKGDNLKEIVDFTGVYKEGFKKWFHNSWEEYEKYVHEHNNIFKIFNEDGSHMEVPVGAWIIKAPDGYNTASRFAISPILTEISIESNFKFKKAIECIENYVNSFPQSQRPEIWQHINFLKSLKDRVQPQPKQEWSKEDEAFYQRLEQIVCKVDFEAFQGDIDLHSWLKSLRPQNSWKPSMAQLNALSIVSKGNATDDIEAIVSLYQDLKKLREE